jgi:hypothetical protein
MIVLCLLVGSSIAHTLSKGKAAREAGTWVDAFAGVVAKEGPASWRAEEGAIGQCRRKNAHTVDCDIVLSILDQATSDRIACVTTIRVQYKNSRSRKLRSKPIGRIDCGKLDFNPPPQKK